MIACAQVTPIVLAAHGADALLTGARRVSAQRERAHAALDRAFHDAGVSAGPIMTDAHGAPIPVHGWHWSISHTRDCAAAVVALQPVGIDVEPIALRQAAQWPSVVSPAELALIGELDALAFARLWTAKEALLKRAGVGLAELSACQLTGIRGAHGMRLLHRGEQHFIHQAIERGFVVSLAAGLEPDARVAWTWSA